MTHGNIKQKNDVCILGLGYIGLPTASILAATGMQVLGVDTNASLVQILQDGNCLLRERDLDVMVRSAVQSGNLRVSDKPEEADTFIICVPTPFKEGNAPDISFVETAVRSIAPFVRAGNLVILESTIPVGTTEKMAALLAGLRPDLAPAPRESGAKFPFSVAHCPERVLPGRILHELVENDRIVGGVDAEATRRGVEFYRTFVKGAVEGTDARTAEMIKLAENSFRDVNIAFANELSLICDELGLDVWQVIALANRHPRVNILRPGPGVGGHCIAVDPWFLVDSAPNVTRLIRTAREVNDAKPATVIAHTLTAAGARPDATVACLGLAFKPDVDDLRQSPAVTIVEALARAGIRLVVCDPCIPALPPTLANRPNVEKKDLDTCLREADVILVLVGHSAFAGIDAQALARKTVIDACGLWRHRERTAAAAPTEK